MISVKKNKIKWEKLKEDEYPEFPVDLLILLDRDDIKAERILELEKNEQIAKLDKEVNLLKTEKYLYENGKKKVVIPN